MPTMPSPEPKKKPDVGALHKLLITLYLGRAWTTQEWHEAQTELYALLDESRQLKETRLILLGGWSQDSISSMENIHTYIEGVFEAVKDGT